MAITKGVQIVGGMGFLRSVGFDNCMVDFKLYKIGFSSSLCFEQTNFLISGNRLGKVEIGIDEYRAG